MSLDTHLPPEIIRQLSHLAVHSTQRLNGSGLSGANIWKCHSPTYGMLCLRKWPTGHPDEIRLKFMHATMQFARDRGLDFVPQLHRAGDQSYSQIRGCFWEVSQWMPGQADYDQLPDPEKLNSAIDALADLHRVWFEFNHRPAATSPAVTQRIELLSQWLGDRHLVASTGRAVRDVSEGTLCLETVKALQLHGNNLLGALNRIASQTINLQPVMRDIWSEHLLFEDRRVVGIIDYGAMKVDEPATDLARMLGSLEPFNEQLRKQAVNRYNERNITHPVSWERVDLLDRSGSLLTAMQWMQWLVLERRPFPVNPKTLFDRWQRALARTLVA